MNIFQKVIQNAFGIGQTPTGITENRLHFPSKSLGREVIVDVFLPPQYLTEKHRFFPVAFFNDGQDMTALNMKHTLEKLYVHQQTGFQPFIVVAMYCNHDRINEYGTASRPDYKGRGAKAAAHTAFVVTELVAYIRKNYRVVEDPDWNIMAGFSLGGLSAIDIAWANPHIFGKVGVFSGAFWWRWRDFTPNNPDGFRIMHEILAETTLLDAHKKMKFWFQVGTNDETDDRNKNGIIDSIDDTLDIVDILAAKGFKPHRDLKYNEIQGGEHNPHTWKQVMPDFLTWAFTKQV